MAKVELRSRNELVEFSEIYCGTYFIYDGELWLKVAEVGEYDNAFAFREERFTHFDDEAVEVVNSNAITIKVD